MAIIKSTTRKLIEIIASFVGTFAAVTLAAIALVSVIGGHDVYDITTASSLDPYADHYDHVSPDWSADFKWIMLIALLSALVAACVVVFIQLDEDDMVAIQEEYKVEYQSTGPVTESSSSTS
ncbi:MAG: hypothetical protein JWN38_618 [Candidatus Saccharibacteria bacterium]|nr:hypothetical protein [Candidatus Saccharibacteria bacterium]